MTCSNANLFAIEFFINIAAQNSNGNTRIFKMTIDKLIITCSIPNMDGWKNAMPAILIFLNGITIFKDIIMSSSSCIKSLPRIFNGTVEELIKTSIGCAYSMPSMR